MGISAKEIFLKFTDGDITQNEAAALIDSYEKIAIKRAAIAACCIVAMSAVIAISVYFFSQARITTEDECLLNYTKQGMSEDAAINIRIACRGKYGE